MRAKIFGSCNQIQWNNHKESIDKNYKSYYKFFFYDNKFSRIKLNEII